MQVKYIESTCHIKLHRQENCHAHVSSPDKDNIQQRNTSSSVKRSNEDNSPVEGNVSKKTNTKATLLKTSQLKLNKEDLGMDLLHEIQLMRNDMNKNHSELSAEVDLNITELKSVQLCLSNLIGLPA